MEEINNGIVVESVKTGPLEHSPVKSKISYEDYEKLDIRICKITSVQKVENKDRLYKLSIDTGFELRVAVSSIADKFKPEELQDQNFPFILNLEPRKIAGIESHAMIILAEKSGSLQRIDSNSETGAIVI